VFIRNLYIFSQEVGLLPRLNWRIIVGFGNCLPVSNGASYEVENFQGWCLPYSMGDIILEKNPVQPWDLSQLEIFSKPLF